VGDTDVVGHLHRRLIAFDLDGTLVDSRRDLANSANQLIEELGGRPLPEDDIGRMVGEGAALLVSRALNAAGIDAPAGALPRFLDIYDRRLLEHTRLYDGIIDAVHSAKRIASIAVLTNKPAHATGRLLDGLGLDGTFDEVIGGDGPYPRKPDPSALTALMERAGAPRGRTLLVGDSAIDHETARRARVRCCLATYGFGYVTFPAERPADDAWTVASPVELAAIFERFTAWE
jgi:phosphoglycolate phosphatase